MVTAIPTNPSSIFSKEAASKSSYSHDCNLVFSSDGSTHRSSSNVKARWVLHMWPSLQMP